MLFSRGDKSEEKKSKKQSTLGFLFNPQIGRDVRPLVESAGMFVRMLALILASYRLFPKDHPAFKDNNVRLTFSEVLSTSFNTLQFTRQGIPQILAFIAVFGCIVFSALFIVTFLLSILMGSAHAQLFDGSTNAPNDWARQWVDYLFMGTDMTVTNARITPPRGNDFQRAVASALSLYSTAILALAGFLLIYHLTFMIAETAHTGKPMGRANQIWAPIRLVFAIGMLVPIGTAGGNAIAGYNTGQYLSMQVARWGSGLASNIWVEFLTAIEGATKIGCTTDAPNSPACIQANRDSADLVKSLVAIDGCAKIIRHFVEDSSVRQYVNDYNSALAGVGADAGPPPSPAQVAAAYEIRTLTSDTSREAGRHLYGVNVGNQGQFNNVELVQLCGGFEIMPEPSGPYAGVYTAQQNAFFDVFSRIDTFTTMAVQDIVPGRNQGTVSESYKAQQLSAIINSFQTALNNSVTTAMATADQTASNNAQNSLRNEAMARTGWLTAASWFSRLSSVYSERAMAVRNALPNMIAPSLLNFSSAGNGNTNQLHDILADSSKYYQNFNVSIGNQLDMTAPDVAVTGNQVGSVNGTNTSGSLGMAEFFARLLKSGFVSTILEMTNLIGYWGGMWDLNGQLRLQFGSTLNPVGELVAFGHNCIGGGLMAMNWGGVAYTVASLSDATLIKLFTLRGSKAAAPLLSGLASLLMAIAGICLAIGFTLSFIVPLFPFYRFFFASLGWIMSVFEAVVLMPLLALAHVNPYGEGLAGSYNKYGYQVLLQVLLRPVLMIFGLIAGYLIFGIALHFLNDTFVVVTTNAGSMSTGGNFLSMGNGRDIFIIGKIAYLIIYCVLVFILANQAFSLVGLFPQVALKWFGMGQIQEEKIGDLQHLGIAGAVVGKEILGSKMPAALKSQGDGMKQARGIEKERIADKRQAAGDKKQEEDDKASADASDQNLAYQEASTGKTYNPVTKRFE